MSFQPFALNYATSTSLTRWTGCQLRWRSLVSRAVKLSRTTSHLATYAFKHSTILLSFSLWLRLSFFLSSFREFVFLPLVPRTAHTHTRNTERCCGFALIRQGERASVADLRALHYSDDSCVCAGRCDQNRNGIRCRLRS
jgi:hypothetical protein